MSDLSPSLASYFPEMPQDRMAQASAFFFFKSVLNALLSKFLACPFVPALQEQRIATNKELHRCCIPSNGFVHILSERHKK